MPLRAGRVEFADGRLLVDDTPFFIYGCWGTPDSDYDQLRRRHFNTTLLGWKTAVRSGHTAAASGLMVIPYTYAPGWSVSMREGVAAIAHEDWVLGWDIGGDLGKSEQVPVVSRVAAAVRELDDQRRPLMLDTIDLHEQFVSLADLWCTYAYPLASPAVSAPPSRLPAGFAEYTSWLAHMRSQAGADGFFWTLGQCHAPRWYCTRYLTGKSADRRLPSRFPDGDHLRLVSAHAISAGVRGLLWFTGVYFQADYLGRDRYARAAIIGCELDVVGALLAQGQVGERLLVSDPSVWATPVDFPGGRLICLLKTGENYHYQPDSGEATAVRVNVGRAGRIFQIGPVFRELAEPMCSFTLSSWLLVTEDAALTKRLRARHAAVVPDMAAFASEELEARLRKVEGVLTELSPGTGSLDRARRLSHEAVSALTARKWQRACRRSEEGLTLLRTAQRHAWDEAWRQGAAGLGMVNSEMTDFYLLPRMADRVARLRNDGWGQNVLRNGTFESDTGWGGAILTHDAQQSVSIAADGGRHGTRALRLFSDDTHTHAGLHQDWVSAHVVSPPTVARAGEQWQISAWVRIPRPLAHTARGFTLALVGYTSSGKPVAGTRLQQLEARRVTATDGWEQMTLVVPIRSATVASVAVRAALCGMGEALVDDVSMQRLVLPLDD